MALESDVKKLADCFKEKTELLKHNDTLFNIYEGDLLTYVLEALKAQLSAQSFEQCAHRAAPINLLKRLIDKLSKLYAKPPKRELKGTGIVEKDKQLLEFYMENYDINTNGGIANEFFNMFKTTAWEPFLDRGKPRLRIIPSDRFFVYSNDPVNPLRPTCFVKIMGQGVSKKYVRPNTFQQGSTKSEEQPAVTIMYAYTDDQFLIFDSDGEIRDDMMLALGNPQGINTYKRIPFVYMNRSRHQLTPKIDTDTLTMTKLFPILLSDLNFAVMFQAFSIIYGIDLDEENLKMAPNAFWRFKSDPTKEGTSKPSIGVIKPEVDIDQVWRFIVSQLQMWLQSRNIRPGAIGSMTAETAANGISKIIDEMDTSEDRQKQIPYFKTGEQELWDLTFNYMHPEFQKDPAFEMRTVAPSKGITVNVEFAEQRPMIDSSKVIDDGIKKLNARLASRTQILKEIHPDASPEEIEEMLEEIDEETTVTMEDGTDDEQEQDDPAGKKEPQKKAPKPKGKPKPKA